MSNPPAISQSLAACCQALGFSQYASEGDFLKLVASRSDEHADWSNDDLLFELFNSRFKILCSDGSWNGSFANLCIAAGLEAKVVNDVLTAIPWILNIAKSLPEALSCVIVAASGDKPDPTRAYGCPYKQGLSRGAKPTIGIFNIRRGLSKKDYLEELENRWLESSTSPTFGPDFEPWYHGGHSLATHNIFNDGVDISQCRRPHSFGIAPAFYLTNDKREAFHHAVHRMLLYRDFWAEGAGVLTFKLRKRDWSDVRQLQLEDPYGGSDNWAESASDESVVISRGPWQHVVRNSMHPDLRTRSAWDALCIDKVVPIGPKFIQGPNHGTPTELVYPTPTTTNGSTIRGIRCANLAQVLKSCIVSHEVTANTYHD